MEELERLAITRALDQYAGNRTHAAKRLGISVRTLQRKLPRLFDDLLDFGRSRAAERGARERLIAANFTFNRAIQDVVFAVQKAYYVLAAIQASVAAAEEPARPAPTTMTSYFLLLLGATSLLSAL